MIDAIERVAAACPHSKYKDDRHEWKLLMTEATGFNTYKHAFYVLQQCDACSLTILLISSDGYTFSRPPQKDEKIIHAFYASASKAES